MKRLGYAVLMLIAIVGLVAIVAYAAGEDGELSQWRIALSTAIGGIVGIPVVQFIKRKLFPRIGKKLLRWVAYVVAFGLSIGVLAITGGLKELLGNWVLLVTEGSAAFAIGTLVYTVIADGMGLGRD